MISVKTGYFGVGYTLYFYGHTSCDMEYICCVIGSMCSEIGGTLSPAQNRGHTFSYFEQEEVYPLFQAGGSIP